MSLEIHDDGAVPVVYISVDRIIIFLNIKASQQSSFSRCMSLLYICFYVTDQHIAVSVVSVGSEIKLSGITQAATQNWCVWSNRTHDMIEVILANSARYIQYA